MKNEKTTVRLESEKQLRIFTLPLRQRILRTMRIVGRPVTTKQVADMLEIAPSSARHHILKLKEIGLVEHDHYEQINGIKADYLIASDVTVSIGTSLQDAYTAERDSASQVMLFEIADRFLATLPSRRKKAQEAPGQFLGDLIGGIAHLSTEDAEKLYNQIRDFLDSHSLPRAKDDHPWEYAVLLYETEPSEL
ncbi:MAG: helix-turn-helix domain-containing protein [Sphaerochaetaceae bacterium]|jgi:DNA-binding transcriptional ArsR family regulator|nr:helix-turn-helix domain-containing protein [Sphaerochaetaceae bacterium]